MLPNWSGTVISGVIPGAVRFGMSTVSIGIPLFWFNRRDVCLAGMVGLMSGSCLGVGVLHLVIFTCVLSFSCRAFAEIGSVVGITSGPTTL